MSIQVIRTPWPITLRRDRAAGPSPGTPIRRARDAGFTVGGQSVGIKGGRYVRHPRGTPIANLYLAILDKLGAHQEAFGDSTGRLDTLTSG